MSIQARKFGFFAGVFTPSVLTILGVIMYMRLGWVVGQAGLWGALGIILVAHIISISTGLSIASIATDKKIEAGGIYYILSRSLGLPIGGATGITLFIGTALSIALYLVGFAENFLGIEAISSFTGLQLDINGIRIVGSIVILLLVILAFISTSLAIKAQFFILTAIVLSLVSIAVGLINPGTYSADNPVLLPLTGHIPFEAIFAVFFPAVTGFTAGVAMSGDLKDPKKAIPKGTLLSILVGFIVYVSLAIGIGLTIDRNILVNDPNFLMKIAWLSPLVIAGIWGATLSSALGGILGAPRILQALSFDGITPRIFSITQGAAREPRNALLLTYLIAEAGILIGELNVIARIVSMFYIAAYGFINLSLALESWASSDFRPTFRIRPIIGVLGFIACFVVMFRIDILAMVLALIVMSSIYVYLTKKELQLDFGDVWQSVYSSIVRSSLHKMDQRNLEERNWRPNIILFSGGSKARPYLVDFGKWLVGKHGFLSDFDLVEQKGTTTLLPKHEQRIKSVVSSRYKGIFTRKQQCEDIYSGIESITQSYGFAGVEPNTVMLGWGRHTNEPVRFARMLQHLEKLDMNLLLMDYDQEAGYGKQSQIDIWWRGSGQNGNLALTLIRLLQIEPRWQAARIRLLIVNPVNSEQELLHRKAKKVLEHMRLSAEIRIINNQIEQKQFYDIIRAESIDSDLILLGLSEIPEGNEEEYVSEINLLCKEIGSVLLIKASSTFKDLGIGKEIVIGPAEQERESETLHRIEFDIPAKGSGIKILEERVKEFDQQARQFIEKALFPVLEQEEQDMKRLAEHISKSIDECTDPEKEANELIKISQRAQKSISFRVRKLINDMRARDHDKHLDLFQAQIERARINTERLTAELSRRTDIRLPAAFLKTVDKDNIRVRLRKRLVRILKGKKESTYSYHLKIRALLSSRFPSSQHELIFRLMSAMGTHSLSLLINLREAHRELVMGLASLVHKLRDDDTSSESLDSYRAELKRLVIDIQSHTSLFRHKIEKRTQEHLRNEVRVLSEILNNPFPNSQIKPLRNKLDDEYISALPSLWLRNQALLYHASSLDINLVIYNRRIREVIVHSRGRIENYISEELIRQLNQTIEDHQKIRELNFGDALKSVRKLDKSVSSGAFSETKALSILEEAEERIRTAAGIFPTDIEIFDDDSYNRFIAIQFSDDIGTIRVSVRRLIDNIIQEEIVQPLSDYKQWITSELTSKWSELGRLIRMLQFSLEQEMENDEKVSSSLSEELKDLIHEQDVQINNMVKSTGQIVEQTFYRIEERLNSLSQQLTFYPFINKALNFKQYVRKQEQEKWLKKKQGQFNALRYNIYSHIASYWYRQRKTALLAEMIQQEPLTRLESDQRIRDSIAPLKPKPVVLDQLPFFYKQLFLRKNLFIIDYFTGRKALLKSKCELLSQLPKNTSITLCISGLPGSGSSFLAVKLANSAFNDQQVIHLRPPRNGSTDPRIFEEILQKQLSIEGGSARNLQDLPKGSIIIIDNLELWWTKSKDGYKALDQILKYHRQNQNRLNFIYTCNQYTLSILEHTHPLPGLFDANITSGPLNADEIAKAILTRHRAGGMKFSFKDKTEDSIFPWTEARFFSRIYDISGGNISSALSIWLGMISKSEDYTVYLQLNSTPDHAILDHLSPAEREVLFLVLLHKNIDPEKLAKTNLISVEIAQQLLLHLEKVGILRKDEQGIFELEPVTTNWVIRHLKAKSILRS